MGSNASVWQPGSTTSISANTLQREERIVLVGGQEYVPITSFTYAPNVGSVTAYLDGAIINLGTDWEEQTDGASIRLVTPATSGQVLTVIGHVGISAASPPVSYAPVPLNGGVWETGQSFTAYNQYMIYSGEVYSPLPAAALPYLVGAVPDLAKVYQIALNDHSNLSNRNAAGAHTASAITNADGGTLQDIISRVVSGDTGRAYRLQFGVIRNSGEGWFIVNDPVHEPCGIQSVSVEPNGTIKVTHSVGAVEVGTLIAAVDETFAEKGFIVGSSVGTSISFITITAPLNFTVNTAAVTGTLAVPSTAGLTVPPHFGVDIKAYKEGGVVTINHPLVDTNDAPVGTTAGSARKTDFNLAFGTVQTVIQGVGDVDGYIRFDGVDWLVTTTLTVPPTMVWNAGVLTVTHPDCDIYNISIDERDDGYRVSVGSIGNNTFTVKFYDWVTNAQITTQSNLMKFYVSRKAKALKTDISGSVNIRRGFAQVDAEKVISTTGNIWLMGVGNLAP